MINTKQDYQEKVEVDIQELLSAEHRIVLYNDDVNTFDHVIECLVVICEHTYEQAEQCALLVHYKGQCDVKEGEIEKLKPMCTALLEKGLSAEIK